MTVETLAGIDRGRDKYFDVDALRALVQANASSVYDAVETLFASNDARSYSRSFNEAVIEASRVATRAGRWAEARAQLQAARAEFEDEIVPRRLLGYTSGESPALDQAVRGLLAAGIGERDIARETADRLRVRYRNAGGENALRILAAVSCIYEMIDESDTSAAKHAVDSALVASYRTGR